jgi:hypothetical protein
MGALRRNLVDVWADLDSPRSACSQVRPPLDGAGLVVTDSVGSGMNDVKRVGLGLSVSPRGCSDETWLTSGLTWMAPGQLAVRSDYRWTEQDWLLQTGLAQE